MLGRYYGVSMQNVTNGFWVGWGAESREQGGRSQQLGARSKGNEPWAIDARTHRPPPHCSLARPTAGRSLGDANRCRPAHGPTASPVRVADRVLRSYCSDGGIGCPHDPNGGLLGGETGVESRLAVLTLKNAGLRQPRSPGCRRFHIQRCLRRIAGDLHHETVDTRPQGTGRARQRLAGLDDREDRRPYPCCQCPFQLVPAHVSLALLCGPILPQG